MSATDGAERRFDRGAAPREQRAGGRPLRVALVVASLDIVGGHGVEAFTLARHLRGEGVDVRVLPINPAFPRGLRWVRRCPYARTLLNQALYLPSLLRLSRVDVVHVFAASYWSFLLAPAPAMLAARAFGKRVVLNYHSGEAADHLARWGVLVRPLLKMAHAIAVPSHYLGEIFARHGYAPRVIPNVVDLSRFPRREPAPIRPRFLSTRNLEPYYDVANTLEAFAQIRVRHPEASLAIAGSGSAEASLRRRAGALGLRDVRFLGRVEPSAMPAIYAEADVFLNSSVVDNQPLSLLEAMAAGLPVISTPPGDIPAMLAHGDAGVLVPDRDPAAMAKAAIALLESPERARALATAARALAGTHQWPAVRERWLEAYAGATP